MSNWGSREVIYVYVCLLSLEEGMVVICRLERVQQVVPGLCVCVCGGGGRGGGGV